MKKLILFTLALLITNTVQANPPIISNFWTNTDLSKSDCLSKASNSVREAGFTERLASTSNDAFGVTPDMKYTGQVLCITEKNIVVFNVSGESGSKAHQFTKVLHKAFSK